MDLREALKAARRKSGLKLIEVADQLGVSHATVSRWEAGRLGLPDLDVLSKWAAVVGLRLQVKLIEDSPNPADELRELLTDSELLTLLASLRVVKKVS